MLWEPSFSEELEAMPQMVPRSGRSPIQGEQTLQGERAVPASPGSPATLQHILRLLDATSPIHSMQSLNDYQQKPPPAYVAPQTNYIDKLYELPYNNTIYSATPSPLSEEGSIILGGFRSTSPYYNTNLLQPTQVKKENHLLTPEYGSPYPLSPCPSNASGIASPGNCHRSIEDEYVDIEALLQENHHYIRPKLEIEDRPKDHILLRSVLEDTSFQRRLNIKPVQLEQLGSIKMEEDSNPLAADQIEEVLSLAIEHTRKDVHDTCAILGISPDPMQWNVSDVCSWVTYTARQFSLPSVACDNFNMDGATLITLTEDDFIDRTAQAGSTLFAQLEIWKAASPEDWKPPTSWTTTADSQTNNQTQKTNNEDVSEDDDSDTAPVTTAVTAPCRPGKGGSHIHLWQFLKELLSTPEQHGTAIRWLDRSTGVFKIEDSVRVARLWGKRKNRPAMNYDKLSRSIRQYYKKGIMKKTERSQRLVYQFCHPYSL